MFKAISKYKPSGAYIRRGDLTEESVCITSLDGLYLEGLIHGGIFPECSVQYIGQVSNRVKTLSRFRILWNVLISVIPMALLLTLIIFIFLLRDNPNNCAYDSH